MKRFCLTEMQYVLLSSCYRPLLILLK